MRLRPPRKKKRPAPPTSNLGTDRPKSHHESENDMRTQDITTDPYALAEMVSRWAGRPVWDLADLGAVAQERGMQIDEALREALGLDGGGQR